MSNLTDALIAAKLVGGSGGSGGGSGLPSTTYYIMVLEPLDDDVAKISFYRPNGEDRDLAMYSIVNAERDAETGAERLVFNEVTVNPDADPPVTDADIAALKLKLAFWQNDSYGGALLFRLITGEADGEVGAEFYVYPYIL